MDQRRHVPESSVPSPAADAGLRERFTALWRRCLLPGAPDEAERVWEDLGARYAEPQRHYHTARHVADCLGQLDRVTALLEHPDRVELAVWFHDVVYTPGARDNEERSAELFRLQAGGRMAPALVNGVADLILVTVYGSRPADGDQRFMCDIDLAGFGCPWDCFLRDSRNVKAEFPGPEADYFPVQRRFLEGLQGRSRIFYSDFFHHRLEAQARANIHRLLQALDARQDLERL